MGIVIPFPTKEDFIEKYGKGLHPDLIDCIKDAYDSVKTQLQDAPSLTISADRSNMTAIDAFQKEYKSFLLSLFSQLLQAKVEICLLQRELSDKSKTQ